jgi:hypothetical protein
MRSGPMRRVPAAMSSRLSARYDAKNSASAILANSPGWKLTGPMLTQIFAPPTLLPMPGTSGIISSPAPTARNVHL